MNAPLYDFSVGYEDLKQRYLQFSVYDFDRFSRHDLIGHVVLKGLLDSTDLHQELEFTMNVLCAPQVRHTLRLMLKYDIVLYCIVVGSRRLMPPDALQPKAYCTNSGL